MDSQQLREIYEKSPIGIIFHNKDGKLTDINQSALEILHIPSIDAVKDVTLYDNPEIASRKNELIEDLKDSKDLKVKIIVEKLV